MSFAIEPTHQFAVSIASNPAPSAPIRVFRKNPNPPEEKDEEGNVIPRKPVRATPNPGLSISTTLGAREDYH